MNIKKLQQRQKEVEQQLNSELEKFGADIGNAAQALNEHAKVKARRQKTSRLELTGKQGETDALNNNGHV